MSKCVGICEPMVRFYAANFRPDKSATFHEIPREEQQQAGADPGEGAVQEIRARQACRGGPAAEERVQRGADLETAGQPAEVGNTVPLDATDGEWKIAGRDAILRLVDGTMRLITAAGRARCARPLAPRRAARDQRPRQSRGGGADRPGLRAGYRMRFRICSDSWTMSPATARVMRRPSSKLF